MGIDNVAIQTFNSSGSQSVCRANKYKEDTLIESDFLTKCTTRYISGTGQTVVQGSITGFPVGLPSNASNHDTFNMPDDIDAISNIILTGRMTFDIPESTSALATNIGAEFAGSSALYFSNTMFLSIIDKIEIKLGGLIIDTISSDTIFSRNTTEISGDVCTFSGSSQTGTECPNIYTNVNQARVVSAGNNSPPQRSGCARIKDNIVEWSISVPFTGRGSKMSDAFLQAGSSTNTLSMKVYYKQFNPLNTNLIPTPRDRTHATPAGTDSKSTHPKNSYPDGRAYWPVFGYHHLTDESMMANNWKFSTSATVTTHMMTETEKNFIRNNVVNRVLKTSETLEYQTPEKLVNVNSLSTPAQPSRLEKPQGEFREISFDVSTFDCNCSHILLSLREPSGNQNGGFSPTPNGWPHTKGWLYDLSKTADTAHSTAKALLSAGLQATFTGPEYGPWPLKPFYDGWWSGEDNFESSGPLIPSKNMGEFDTHNFCPVKHTRLTSDTNMRDGDKGNDNNGIQMDLGYDLITWNPRGLDLATISPLQATASLALANAAASSAAGDTAGVQTYEAQAAAANTSIQNLRIAAAAALDKTRLIGASADFYPNTGVYGYPDNWLHSVELVIGGERTGFIPSTALKSSNLEEFGLKSIDQQGGIYVLKLADSAFSTSGIPFAKCNNIKLNIRINNSIYAGSDTSDAAAFAAGTKSWSFGKISVDSTFIDPASTWGRLQPKLVATACGTTIQTTVGGSISLAA